MDENKHIDPHFMLTMSTCDFCGINKGKKHMEISECRMGWNICNTSECESKSSDNLHHYVISYDKIFERFGETVNVQRSSGEIENDWVIASKAYRTSVSDQFKILVRRMVSVVESEKMIDYDELCHLNPPISQYATL